MNDALRRDDPAIDTPASPFDFIAPAVLQGLLAEPPAFRGVVGPLAIELFASSPRIAGLASAALAHTADDRPTPQTIKVALIDSAESDVPAPPPLPGTEHLRAPHDDVGVRCDGRISAIYQAESRTWQSFDAARSLGLIHTADARLVAPWEWAAPVKCVIEWATQGRPYGLLHSAVLARADGGGVLLAGGSGTGKSTTTAAAVLNGLKTAGDDVTLIEWREGGSIFAHALYDSLKVGHASLALLKNAIAGDGKAIGPGIPKHLLRLSTVRPGSLVRSVRLRAVLLPRLTGGARTQIMPANSAEGFRALGPVSAFVMRVAPAAIFARASRLARDLPSHALHLSDDPFEAAGAIAAFLDTLDGDGQ